MASETNKGNYEAISLRFLFNSMHKEMFKLHYTDKFFEKGNISFSTQDKDGVFLGTIDFPAGHT